MILTILFTIFISFLVFHLLQRLRFKLPPGPRPWPIIGNLPGLKPVQFRCFNDWAQIYGPIISVRFGSDLNIVVSSSKLAEQVLKEHDHVLSDRQRPRTHVYNTAGKDLIWADYGPHYIKVKKICNTELLCPSKIEALKPIRDDEIAAMITFIYRDCTKDSHDKKSGQPLLLRKYLGQLSLNNITRLVFGKRFVDEEGELDEQGKEFRSIVMNGMHILMKNTMLEHLPWLRFIKPSNQQEFIDQWARVDRLTTDIIDAHNRARFKSGDTKQHFVDALETLKGQYDLTSDTISGLLWNMILGGMDTIAIAVEWAMAELLKNPKTLQNAQQELDRVIGPDRLMTEDDIPSLPYLQAVVKEAMRLHPPVPLMLPHKAKTNVKIGGFDIPKGAAVHVNVWAIGRDPSVWSNPLEFRPERFIEMDVDVMGHDFRLLPFGAGRRVCVGANLGLKMVNSVLGHLLHQFNWCIPDGVKTEDIDLQDSDSLFVNYMAVPLIAQAAPKLAPHLYERITTNM